MVRIGKVVGNLMVDLNPSNVKLRDRAARIVAELTGCGYEENGWHIGENRHRLMPIFSDGYLGQDNLCLKRCYQYKEPTPARPCTIPRSCV